LSHNVYIEMIQYGKIMRNYVSLINFRVPTLQEDFILELDFLTNLLFYFLIYSFFGWILETVYKSVLQKKYVNSGFLFGPFCPIYGFGAVILYLFLDSFKDNLVLVFLIGMIIFSIWECVVGYWLEKFFNTKYWDYSNEKFNFKGRRENFPFLSYK